MTNVVPIRAPDALENVEAEAMILAAMMMAPELADQIAKRVTGSDFFEPIHARAFDALMAEHQAGRTPSPLLLKPYFENDPDLAALGGMAYFARLSGDSQALLAPLELCDQVHELGTRRKVREAMAAAAATATDLTVPFSEAMEAVSKAFDADALRDISTGYHLPHFWFNQAEPDLEASDFVEGLLTEKSMSVVYGPSNCGKTFFVLDMALHVAWGREWRGRAVDRGAVLYLSLEGAQGIRNRLAAFQKHYGIGNLALPFVAMPKPIDLLHDAADIRAVIDLAKQIEADTGFPVSMIVVDTLSRAMAGGNENSPEDMTALIGNCDRIRHATGSHVCVVHHSGKDEAKGARGHSSLRAATDTEIEIRRDPELTISNVKVVKQRDLEAGDPFAFSLQSVVLGTNRRGRDVTSCVVVEAERTVALARDPNQLSPKETEALQCLERCIEAGGFDRNMGRDIGVTSAVTLHAWKRSLQASQVIDRDNDNNARTQMRRVKNALVNKGQIFVEGDHVCIA